MEKLVHLFQTNCAIRRFIKTSINCTTIGERRCSDVSVSGFKNFMVNRNPRNLERMRISRKPSGYHLDKPGKKFWHKLTLIQKPRHVIASVCHNNSHVAVVASTNEWGISKHLYRCNDINAYMCLAHVLAERCLQSGINEMISGVDCGSYKRREFIRCLEEAGISLQESPVYTPLTPWSIKVDSKPWKVHLD